MGEEFERIALMLVLLGQHKKIAAFGRAGIVDENVEAAEFPPCGIGQCGGSASFPQIECMHNGLAAFGGKGLSRIPGRLFIAPGGEEVATLIPKGGVHAAAHAPPLNPRPLTPFLDTPAPL